MVFKASSKKMYLDPLGGMGHTVYPKNGLGKHSADASQKATDGEVWTRQSTLKSWPMVDPKQYLWSVHSVAVPGIATLRRVLEAPS